MALVTNQINDKFQQDLGRPATDYELKKYATASIQDLANLKNTYANYKPDQSLVDYLASQGKDPSMQSRADLAKAYGINDYTSNFDQNVELLKKMKSGAPVSPTVPGTVSPAYNSTDYTGGGGRATNSSFPLNPNPTGAPLPDFPGGTTKTPPVPAKTTTTPATPATPGATTPATGSTDMTGSISGSISSAATPATPPTTTPPSPSTLDPMSMANQQVDDAYKAQQDAQKAVRDIDATLASVKKSKMDEIARSGGVVNEASLTSEILRENEPLLARRKELVGEYTTANQNYQKAVAEHKQSQADLFKSTQLAQGQEKIDVQQSQFAQKLEQTGWKSNKVNIYDAGGNVVGQKIVWSANPGTTTSSNKQQFTSSSSGSGGISKNGVTSVGNTATLPKLTLADGATPSQVLQTLISGPTVAVKGSTVPISQQTLYNLAVADMMGSTTSAGGRTPSGAIIAVKNKETDIMNAYGLTPFDVATAKADFKNLTAANAALLGTAAFTKTYAATATDNLQLALEQSNLVPRGGAKLVNNYKQWVAGNFTPAGDLAKFETYIYTAAREYAKVTSGGAKSAQGLTDSAQSEVDKLVNASQSPEVFKQVVEAMKADMANVTSNFDKQTSSFPDSIKALYGLAGSNPALRRDSLSTGVEGDKQFVEKSLTRQGLNYDTLIAEMKTQAPPGTQPALDNSDGSTVFATPEEISSGKFTAL